MAPAFSPSFTMFSSFLTLIFAILGTFCLSTADAVNFGKSGICHLINSQTGIEENSPLGCGWLILIYCFCKEYCKENIRDNYI